jgi:hypothetical protein
MSHFWVNGGGGGIHCDPTAAVANAIGQEKV